MAKDLKQPYIDQPIDGSSPINSNNTQGAVTDEVRKRFLLGGRTGNLCIRGDASKGLWAGNANFDLAPWSVDLAGLMAGIIQVAGVYLSIEYDNGSKAGTATVNWNNGNVQYITLTAATVLTFTNPHGGGRYILHVAGAYTPTFPATCRFTDGITPTATATAGHKDIYTLIYSAKEGLYDVLQSPNYAIT